MWVSFFESEVMQSALFPALLTAAVASTVSVMIVAHRLAFLTVGVSHASMAGLGLALLLSWPLLPTATVFAILVALLLAPIRQGIHEDAGTGLLFAGSMALGILLISLADSQSVDVFGLMFGDILTVSEQDTDWFIINSICIFVIFIVAARTWWSLAFDATTLVAGGVSATPWRLLLHATVGMTVMLCIKLAGIILTTGLLVLPASCAWFWGRRLLSLWALSLTFALTGVMGGLMISYHYDWPSGACVVLGLCILFIISWGSSWLRNRKLRPRKHL
ncbi:MAG: metal ABC transporter permease [Mariprofundaceae bacterium]|nr:metal ABC transporter permease [Mariprofundaceae bacterium]